MIDGYPEGSDLTVLNTIYIRPRKEEVQTSNSMITEKWTPDLMIIIYRDNKTKQVKHTVIEEPTYTYFVANEGKAKDYSQLFIPAEDVHPITTKYSQLEKSIAENIGRLDEYKQNKINGDWKGNKRLHTDPRVFFSDMNIEDYYRFRFNLTYKNDVFPINKGFFDIEVDGKDQMGDFPELGECPINCLSYYNESNNKIYTFILRNASNPLIEEFEKSINNDLYREIYDFLINAVGGKEKADDYGITGVQFDLLFFDSEISLIHSFFKLVHKLKPNFMEGWNMSAFDTPYIIERIRNLGFDPEEIMCDPSFKRIEKYVTNFVDQRSYNQLNKRSDFTVITGDVVWIDQMLQFAQVRSGKYGSFNSFKLDDIGYSIAGVRKLDYSHITTDITKFPYLNFKLFVMYNIMDTVVQKCIEACCNDLEYVLAKCLVNNTSYSKCHRQTVYLANRITKECWEKGLVIGNNINKDNEKPDKYAGAIVTEPTLTNDKPKVRINGDPVMLVDNAIDEDYKALYPSITMECNIAPNTQVGKIVIENKIYDKENLLNEEKYTREGEFIENLVCDNILEFARRYFGLATFKEFILYDLMEFLEIESISVTYRVPGRDPLRYHFGSKKINPIHEVTSGKKNPIIDLTKPAKEYAEYMKEIRDSL